MPNTIKIILGEIGTTNYQPTVFLLPVDPDDDSALPTRFISWTWISADQIIEPGTYTIPEGQRTDLTWFYDNNFRLDDYGRRHIGYCMTDFSPESVTVI